MADFLAELITLPQAGAFRLLDPGAGVGSLSAAVAARVISERPDVELIITAFEVDKLLAEPLVATLNDCRATAAEHGVTISFDVHTSDFIEYATCSLLSPPELHDAVIANPPYRKVNVGIPERRRAAGRGLQASNLYTIFTALAADLLADDGQISAIVPRSWANGPYHLPFRRFLLDRIGIDFLHVYEHRGEVFADTDVLQENVVFHGVRGAAPRTVTLSTSRGVDEPRQERPVPIDEVIHPGDSQCFVRIPADARATEIAVTMGELPATLHDLGLRVSTGRVVDFRAREWLRADPEPGTVPLIYPGHLRDGRVIWPAPGARKPNAIIGPDQTPMLMLPNETYVLVKRFSAKEERRRVTAAVLSPEDLPDVPAVGIENHLNVFHRSGCGIDAAMAAGLCAFLNSTIVDDHVRSFSGHTQINATDLRQLRYPSRAALVRLGDLLAARHWPTQNELDRLIADHLLGAQAPMLQAA